VKVIRPEKFIKSSRSKTNLQRRFNRVKKKGMQKRASSEKLILTKLISTETEGVKDREVKYTANSVEAPFVFAIRVRYPTKLSVAMQRTLKGLRLINHYEGVFVKLTPSSLKMLQLVDPFVIYGMPSKQTVSELINRRGHTKVDGKRVPISNNIIIEQALGDETGIICVEDLVHEICCVGGSFGQAANFLWPFSLTKPVSEFEKKFLDEKDSKIYGDIGEGINDFIRKLL